MTDQTSSVKLYDGFVAAFAQAEMVGSTSVWRNDDAWNPSTISALRLVLTVVDDTANGAVPVARLELSCPARKRLFHLFAVAPRSF